jgi:hypothetical protein
MKSVASKKQVRAITMIGNRYYVQRLTEQVFLIRERTSSDGASGPDDRIVRSFVFGHDDSYVDSMNEKQKKLDEDHNHQA